MDSTSQTLFHSPPLELNDETESKVLVFDTSLLQKHPSFPTEFIWPRGDTVAHTQLEELKEPLVDLEGFLKSSAAATSIAAELIRAACLTHGFFQVTNHGIDAGLIRAAHDHAAAFFKLPIEKKVGAGRKRGSVCGYSGAHADRYSSRLPWKETLSFGYRWNGPDEPVAVAYFKSVFGDDFEATG